MGERIQVFGIHKKCGKENLFRSAGGDIMVWCDYCGEQLDDPDEEILTKDGCFKNMRLWRDELDTED